MPFLELPVKENVRTGLLFGNTNRENPYLLKKTEDIVSFCDLAPRADILAANLTVVERKRLEIARLLACGPEIALFDEPLQGLNPKEWKQAAALIGRIRKELRVTILLVEHNVKALAAICDRIIVLNYGIKIAEGTFMEVSNNPEVIEAYLGEEAG